MTANHTIENESFSLGSGPKLNTTPDAERLIRKQETALGYRIMASWGWGADGSGHITARDPELTDCFWLLKYGVPFGEATIDDLVLVNDVGEVVELTLLVPSTPILRMARPSRRGRHHFP